MEDGLEFPVDPREAFGGREPEQLDSQITLILLLGAVFGRGRPSVRRDAERTREQFPIPEAKEPFLLDPGPYLAAFPDRFGLPPVTIMEGFEEEDAETSSRRREIAADLVERVYAEGNPDTVADLILLGLGDTNEFIRVAAAISYLDVFQDIGLAARNLIAIAADHSDELAGMMAETALLRLGFVGLGGPPAGVSQPPSSGTKTSALLVHGSHFAFVGGQIGTWWQPGGNFHSYIKTHHRSKLYNKPDCYTWSGGWSDHARKLAAIELRDWTRNRNIANIDVLAHSHGGNVVMWATQLGLQLNKLILLSCPEHLPYYEPEFSRVNEVISYHIQLDWVVIADGGGTYFNHPKIDDRVQDKWFRRHTDTHDPAFWRKYGLSM